MGSKISADDDVISDINITPFVDIILVVLIIFMVTATTGILGMAAELPSAANTEALDGDSVGITLVSTGQLLVDGEPTAPAQLRTILRDARAKNPDVVCLISANKDVEWGRLVWLMDLLKDEGQTKYFFNTDKATAVGPDPASSSGQEATQ